MLSWFQTKVNISEFVKCFQKLNDRFYVTCKDRECKEVLLNDFSRTTRTPDWIVGNDVKVGERSSMIIVAYF
jgi:hypothetical protein